MMVDCFCCISLVLDAVTTATESKQDMLSARSNSESDFAQQSSEDDKKFGGQAIENLTMAKSEIKRKGPGNDAEPNSKAQNTWQNEWEMHYLEQSGKR
jgi:hypothetical protein